MTCPKCGGAIYDNRADKASGAKTPKWPDFKCRSKTCDWAQWPPKAGAAPVSAPIPSAPPSPSIATANGPVGPSPRDTLLIELYMDSLDRIMEKLKREKFVDLFHGDAIAAMAATLFIARSKA